jgi:hypothetical protein
LEQQVAELLAQAAEADRLETSGRWLAATARARGQRPRAHIRPRQRDAAPNPTATVNTTDPDSRVVRGNARTLQGYNAQAAATTEQVVVAAELTSRPTTSSSWPDACAIATTLAAAGIGDRVQRLAADSGYGRSPMGRRSRTRPSC